MRLHAHHPVIFGNIQRFQPRVVCPQQIDFLVAEPCPHHNRRNKHIARPWHPHSPVESHVLEPLPTLYGHKRECGDFQHRAGKYPPLDFGRQRHKKRHLPPDIVKIPNQSLYIGVGAVTEKMGVCKQIELRTYKPELRGIRSEVDSQRVVTLQKRKVIFNVLPQRRAVS